jgi:uncharacterized protein (DUF1499 family)
LRYYLHESRKAVWSYRIALCFLVLFAVTFALHRVGQLQTPVAMKLSGVAIVGAVIAVVLGFVALGGIWQEGHSGAGKALTGIALGALILGGPLWSLPSLLGRPRIYEVSTDLRTPPAFNKIAELRNTGGANPSTFHADAAPLQVKAYPDIKPLPVNRPTEDAYTAVREAVKNLKWRIVAENPPAPGRTGTIEATHRSLIFGFTDDMVIRVTNADNGSRVDVRSSARHGSHDLGRNADEVRDLFSEVKTRLADIDKNETMEKAVALREIRVKKALEKKEKEQAEAEREERRQRAKAAALMRERQISSSGSPDQAASAQPSQAAARPGAQGAQESNKPRRRVERTLSLRRFWEELSR